MLSPSPSILTRSHPAPHPSPLQAEVDGLVSGFLQQATDWRSLASIAAGGMAYRVGRVGVMGLGSGVYGTPQTLAGLLRGLAQPGLAIRAASVGFGLSAEVSTFELVHRGLHTENPNLWRWNGSGGIRQGLFQSFITFGALKGAGHLTRGQNLILQHFAQDTAMVAGHQASGALGIGPRPTGALAEQFLHAEATNLQLGAGMALAYRFAPGIHGLERGLDLMMTPSPFSLSLEGDLTRRLQPAAAGGGSREKTNSRPSLSSPLILMASGDRRRDDESSDFPVTSDIRPKPLSREDATSGTYSYPPVVTRETEARYRMVVESATDGIVTVGEDGHILFLNPAIRRIFGYESAELLGKPLSLLMSPEMAHRHESAFHRYVSTGQRSIPWEAVSLTGVHKDGHEISLEISFGEFFESGHRTFTAVLRDVSERRKAERALFELTERNEALLRVTPYKFCRVHRDGTILDVRSNQAEDLLKPPERLIGTNVRDLPLPEALREITTVTLPRALQTGEVQVIEYPFPHPDGRNLFQRARILKSGPDEVVWITEDITEHKREEAVRLEGEKNETLLLVSQGLAHDINNALGSGLPYVGFIKDSAQGLISLLSEPSIDRDALRAGLELILEDSATVEESMNRIRGMTTEFGELNGKPKPVMPIDLHSLVQKRKLLTYLGSGIPLVLRTEPEPFPVRGNNEDLTRTIENLVINARDAMQSRSNPVLTVATHGIDLNTDVLARLLPMSETGIVPGRFMRLRVQDTGHGMDPATLSQIFRPYFSTKVRDSSRKSPRGIGLAISRNQIRYMGGFMAVKSILGEGTIFDLYLREAPEDPSSKPLKRRYPPPTLPPPSIIPENPPPEGG